MQVYPPGFLAKYAPPGRVLNLLELLVLYWYNSTNTAAEGAAR
jgi:hypothetical protein